MTACSSGGVGDLATGGDASAPSPDGAAPDSGPVACGGCNCGSPTTTQGKATPAQACAIAGDPSLNGSTCKALCGALPGNNPVQTYYCSVPSDYQVAYQRAQPDASSGVDAGVTCPAWTDDVVVQCGYPCLGRRTEGMAEPAMIDARRVGEVFANRAYLEAVSVHAFARLERELAFHGAPPALLREARRARRDEARHTAMTTRLARRFGAAPTLPVAPRTWALRSLFEVARENAIEGCVHETYGAVVGLIEANSSSDAEVRRAARSIAEDECRHAELALAIARWITPLLDSEERAEIHAAVSHAVGALRARGNERVVDLLAAQVWSEQSQLYAA